MTKPLELTIYPLRPRACHCCHPGYEGPNGPVLASSVDAQALNKGLTEAELAAEYWQSGYADVRYDREDEDLEPIPEIIHRFATLPDAADNGYE